VNHTKDIIIKKTNTMRNQNFKIEDLINSLRGTCSTIDKELPEDMEFEDLTDKEAMKLDLEIFQCAQCGWWYDVSEMSENDDDQYCEGCRPPNDDDL
jgi:hypothetical protein